MSSLARKASRVVAELGLTVLAIAGAACIALVIAAEVFGVSIILFSTGSMSPTIPAGSAALVRETPAGEVVVGDVVTVDRPGALPVTHRVVAVQGTGPTRELTLRGDANPVDDPSPYTVEKVRLVIASVPAIAPAIAAAGSPAILGTVTVLVAGLVTWTFWPRAARRHGDEQQSSGNGRTGEPRPHRGANGSWIARHGSGTALLALAITAVSLAGGAPMAHAAADGGEQVVQGEMLRLTSILDAAKAAQLQPDELVTWVVGVESSADEPGVVTIDLEFGAAGPPLAIAATACEMRWVGTDCPAGARELGSFALAHEAGRFRLDAMPSHAQRWLRLTVGLVEPQEEGAETTPARRSLVVRASGAGETIPIGSTVDGIAETGVPFDVAALAVVGALILAVGGVLLLARRTHVDRDREWPDR